MKKKTWTSIVLAGILVLGVLGFLLYQKASHVRVFGEVYRKDTRTLCLSQPLPRNIEELTRLENLKQLDLRSISVSLREYDALRELLPQTEIVWMIPFQGAAFPQDARELTVTSLSPEDLEVLPYFDSLSLLHAEDCRDYDAIAAAMRICPVRYTVEIGGQVWQPEARSLALRDADGAELQKMLLFLPEVTEIQLLGTLPEAAALDTLREGFPNIHFSWQVEAFGQTLPSETVELDLSGQALTFAEVSRAADYLPELRKVLMIGCGLSNDEMEQLNLDHPGTQFVWEVTVGNMTLRTDVATVIPVKYHKKMWGDVHNLRYCTQVEAVDLGHMPVTSCEFAAYMPKLKYLIIAETNILDLSPLAGLQDLMYLECFNSAIRDYTPLLQCPALVDLNISWTNGDPQAVARLTQLRRLWWNHKTGEPLTDEEQELLRSGLPDCQLMLVDGPSHAGGWRVHEHYYQMRDLFGMPYFDQPGPVIR